MNCSLLRSAHAPRLYFLRYLSCADHSSSWVDPRSSGPCGFFSSSLPLSSVDRSRFLRPLFFRRFFSASFVSPSAAYSFPSIRTPLVLPKNVRLSSLLSCPRSSLPFQASPFLSSPPFSHAGWGLDPRLRLLLWSLVFQFFLFLRHPPFVSARPDDPPPPLFSLHFAAFDRSTRCLSKRQISTLSYVLQRMVLSFYSFSPIDLCFFLRLEVSFFRLSCTLFFFD